MKTKARLIAFYLPQFHPIPENDNWWGPGFTEWNNVVKAKPLFPGHYQPRLPADLGFYDLRISEVRTQQAALASEAGIEGFCYWHYWFSGKRLLQRPFEEVLKSSKPDFPFCLAWANESWKGLWHGMKGHALIEQEYPGLADIDNHFNALLGAFNDPRYIRCNGKPVFVIYQPKSLVNAPQFIDRWNELAVKNGLDGIHFIAHVFSRDAQYDYRKDGFNAALIMPAPKAMRYQLPDILSVRKQQWKKVFNNNNTHVPGLLADKATAALLRWPSNINDYRDVILFYQKAAEENNEHYPTIIPDWDNSARAGRKAVIIHGSSPELFELHVKSIIAGVQNRPAEQRLVFIKSWNEWAEGNYLEPDQRFGKQYLEALKRQAFASKVPS